MKRVFLIIVLALLLSSCTSDTDYGECVGIDDMIQGNVVDTLEYEIDTGNVIVGAILIETIIVPIYVALEETFCPTGVKSS